MSNSVTCFSTTQDKCVESTSNSIPELGIEQGTSVADNITAIAQAILSNKRAIEDCRFCGDQETQSEVVSVVTGSSNTCTATINNVIDISIEPGSSDIGVYYDLTKLKNSLLPSYNVISSQVTIKSAKGSVLFSGNEIASGFNAKFDSFPITLNALIRVNTPCGVVEYGRSFLLESTSTAGGTFTLNADSVAKETLTTQSSVNDYFNSRLDQLESVTNNKEKVSVIGCGGSGNYKGTESELIQVLFTKVCQLQSANDALTEQFNALTESTNESIAVLQASINSLQNQINTLS